jgi:hypothetical protein
MLIAFLLQAAAPAPDIVLDATVSARSVTIRKRGEASLAVRASPEGAGTLVKVEAPRANGRKTIRNVRVNVHAEANIADPQQNPPAVETPQPN